MISADTYNRLLVGLTSPAAATEVTNQLNNGVSTVTDNLTALAGGAKASATPLPSTINRVVTVATAGDSCLLPPAVAGNEIIVINANVTNSIKVYAQGTTDIINALAAATAFSVAATQIAKFTCAVAGKWNVNQVYNLTETVTDALTALAGGAKAGATPLPSTLNRFVTVVTAADSGLLPPAIAGTDLTVVNANVTNAVAIFAAGTDIINALSAATAFSVAATKACRFMCVVAGKWNTQLGA
jgi:hypothetical protein